ncbi:MAG TPA: 2-oxo acid dehydrogenase subunit E2, partial [Salinisphaeraceae bacterium]|nr:2-oxo acid dehydrogenase subunit E2 [Salinisphaeraceae bacterium]
QQEQSKSGGEKKGKEKQQSGGEQQPVAAAPSTRRLAREKGVDLHSIEPSGKQGRVTAEDVEAAAGEQEQRSEQERPTTSLLTPSTVPPQVPDFSQWGEVEREPLRSIRRATARNMAQSWAQVPHVFHEDVADITELERFRRAHEVKHGKLTVTVLMMKALVAVLKRFPRFNASLDVQNQEIVYKHYFHIGLAVATERGLLVPVIRDVDRKSVTELAAESADMAQKTRNGELSRADMSGGCITITNPGSMGGSSLTPLINLPQVAILGMAQARLQPVAEGDLDDYRITARLHLPLVLGFDHRVNDGAEAAQFVTALIDTLADPESLLMAV